MVTLRALDPDGDPMDPRVAELAERLKAALGPLASVLVPVMLPVLIEVLGEAPTAGMADPSRVLLAVEAAAQRLGIGRTMTYELIRSGVLESVRVGRRRLVPVAAIEGCVAKLRAAGGSSWRPRRRSA